MAEPGRDNECSTDRRLGRARLLRARGALPRRASAHRRPVRCRPGHDCEAAVASSEEGECPEKLAKRPCEPPSAPAGRVLTMTLLGHMDMHVATRNRPVYVISIAANLAGCHPRTLRIYEEEGLLEPVRTETNIRLYSDDDPQRVRVIRYLTQAPGVNPAAVNMLLQ